MSGHGSGKPAFDGGLLPAIVRDASSREVLMLAWMNEESYAKTLETGETWFWSRSRRELWHKGATSGNRQKVVRVRTDCDRDAILVDVDPAGPACHTGAVSCFGSGVDAVRLDLDRLAETLRDRRARRPAGSYSVELFDGGLEKIGAKIEEEAAEVVAAAKDEGRRRVIEEVSDLLFHTLALLVHEEIGLDEIGGELRRRETKR